MEISTENQMVCFFLEAFDMGIVDKNWNVDTK